MNQIYIVMYHYVRDLTNSRYPKIKGMDVAHFRKQIEFLNSSFSIINMEELIEAILTKSPLPENAMLLTFDDGYADNFSFIFPILDEFKLQGSFFIPGKTFITHQLLDVNKVHYIMASSNILDLVKDVKEQMDFYRDDKEFSYLSTDELYEKYAKSNRFDDKNTIFVKRMLQTALPEKIRNTISSNLFKKYVGVSEEQLAHELYLTKDQIRLMKRHGMFFGLHGYNHYWLADVSKEEMQNDIDMALNVMDEFIDKKCWVMNYPYGSYNQDVLNYVEKTGGKIGLTTHVKVGDINLDNYLELPRFDCNDFPPCSDRYKDLS